MFKASRAGIRLRGAAQIVSRVNPALCTLLQPLPEGVVILPDLKQQLLDASRGWDPEKYAALERFMTRPRAPRAAAAAAPPSAFVQQIRQIQQRQEQQERQGASTGPFGSFYNILVNAPSFSLQAPAAAGGGGAFASAAGAASLLQQPQPQQHQSSLLFLDNLTPGGGGGAQRRASLGAASSGGGGGGAARFDPYGRPPLSGASRPPSRSSLLAPSPLLARPPATLAALQGAPIYSSAGAHRPLTPFPVKGAAGAAAATNGRDSQDGADDAPGPAGAGDAEGGALAATASAGAAAAPASSDGAAPPRPYVFGSAAPSLLSLQRPPAVRQQAGAAAAASAPAAPRLPRGLAGAARGAAARGGKGAAALLRPMRNTPLRLPGQQQRQQHQQQQQQATPAALGAPATGTKRAAETPLALALALEGGIHHYSSGRRGRGLLLLGDRGPAASSAVCSCRMRCSCVC
jgi:hypothetical protein